MPVIYNNVEIRPAPFASIAKSYTFDDQGHVLTPEYTIKLTGSLVPSGTNGQIEYKMDHIVSAQQYLRSAFSTQYGRLELNSPNGSPKRIEAYCRVESVDIDPGPWVSKTDYSIVLKATQLLDEEGPASEYIKSKTENWSVSENADGTYSVTHSLNAVGAQIFTSSGLLDTLSYAKAWCRDNSYTFSTGTISSTENTFDLSSLIIPLDSDTNYWNQSLSESVGPLQYSWQLTEVFIYNPNGNYREEFTITGNEGTDVAPRATIAIAGTIFGFADKNSDFNTKFDNANTAWATIKSDLYNRVLEYTPAGMTLNPIATTRQTTYDINQGAVRYSYTFTASYTSLIDNAIDEDVSIVDSAPTDVFAQIGIPGRADGPVTQNMGTITSPTRTISITAALTPITGAVPVSSLLAAYLDKPNTEDIITALKPSAGYYYVTQDQETWNPIKRQYSRTVAWTIDTTGESIDGIPSATRHKEV